LDRRVFLYLIPAIMFVSLLYVVAHLFAPPKAVVPTEIGADEGNRCAQGETIACTTPQGCAGHRPCQLGHFGECVPDYECTPGETMSCPYDVCTMGRKECGQCGKWGPCIGPPECGEGDYCPAGNGSA